jgi:hypothetical protein
MKDNNTVLGRVPAKLSTRVMMIRSMFVLLRALERVKPPRSSMIVGENIVENINLRKKEVRFGDNGKRRKAMNLVASGADMGSPSGVRMTLRIATKKGTDVDVTNSGIAYTWAMGYRQVVTDKLRIPLWPIRL